VLKRKSFFLYAGILSALFLGGFTAPLSKLNHLPTLFAWLCLAVVFLTVWHFSKYDNVGSKVGLFLIPFLFIFLYFQIRFVDNVGLVNDFSKNFLADSKTFNGWISEEERIEGSLFRFRIALEDPKHIGQVSPYFALVESSRKISDLEIGDKISVNGTPLPIVDDKPSSYRSYLIESDIALRLKLLEPTNLIILEKHTVSFTHVDSFWMSKTYQKLTAWLKQKLKATLEPDAAAYSYGLVTGDKNEIPKQIRDDFRVTGTYHILAVSGSHAVILAAIFYAFFRFLSFSRATSKGLLLFIIFPPYLFLTAFQVSIMRTYAMALIVYFFSLLDRKIDLLVLLIFAFCLIVVIDPNQTRSVAFQLSFAAVFGMGLAIRLIEAWKISNWWVDYLLISTGAQVFTAPILLYFFGYLNFYSLFYNTLIVFLVPLSLIYSLLLMFSPFALINEILSGALNLLNGLTFKLIHVTRNDAGIFKIAHLNDGVLDVLLFVISFAIFYGLAELGKNRALALRVKSI
jgi:competence protein ComEC